MMKWKTRKETMDIGMLELGNLTFNEDYMEISIDIFDMSDQLKSEITSGIEIEKIRYLEKMHTLRSGDVWSDKPVIMDFTYLHVQLEAGKPIDYSIKFGFHDAENRLMEAWDGSITVDLSEHTGELKKAIIKVLIDRFF